MKRIVCALFLSLQMMMATTLFAVDTSASVKPPVNAPLTMPSNAKEALKRLVEGNQRFAADKITCDDRNSLRRAALLAKQNPFAIILGCADARIPIELVFDQGVGDLFVVRVAGNVAGNSEIESVEYAVKHLNSVLILVLGHEQCAAVASVLEHNAGDIPVISALIESALVSKGSSLKQYTLESAVKANVRAVVEALKNSNILKSILKDRNIMVIGGYYHLSSGLVELLP